MMGKPKKISPQKTDNKQSKISLFFQKGASGPKKPDNKQLFTTVKPQTSLKDRLSLKKNETSKMEISGPGACKDSTEKSEIMKNCASEKDISYTVINNVSIEKCERLKANTTSKMEVSGKTTNKLNIEKNTSCSEQGEKNSRKNTSLAKNPSLPLANDIGSAKRNKTFGSPPEIPAKPCNVALVEKSLTDQGNTEHNQSVLAQASQIIRNIVGPARDFVNDALVDDDEEVTCIPETQFPALSPPPVPTATNPRANSGEKCALQQQQVGNFSNVSEDSSLITDQSIIPDTPEEKPAAGRKRPAYRSFLNSGGQLSGANTLQDKLKHSHGKMKKNAATKKSSKGNNARSLEDALKSVENDLEFASAETFTALVTGIGFGPGPVIPVKETDNADGKAALKPQSKTEGSLSGVKRSAGSGSSPHAKRLQRKTPTKRILHRHKTGDTENDVGERAAKPRKFSRNLSSAFGKNLLLKQEGYPRDTQEKEIHLDCDDNLTDILNHFQSDSSTAPVSRAPKVASTDRTACTAPHQGEESSSEQMIPSHDQPDEALDDIISELRESLTQSKGKESRRHLEGSILSEGISPRVVKTARRRIHVDQRTSPPQTQQFPNGEPTTSPPHCAPCTDAGSTEKAAKNDHLNPARLSSLEGTPKETSSHDHNVGYLGVISNGAEEMDTTDLSLKAADAATVEESLQKKFSEMSPFKNTRKESTSGFDPQDAVAPSNYFGRHKVKAVQNQGNEVLLHLESDPGGIPREVLLTGFWTDVHVSAGDLVHLVGTPSGEVPSRISDSAGLLVVHPDLLISGTSVVSGLHCMRRAVLNERFKGYDSKNIHMLHGTIIHSFFQQVVQQRQFSPAAMEKTMTSVLQQSRVLHDMYGQAVQEDSVLEEIRKYIPQLQSWATKYLKEPPKGSDAQLHISRIADIEENVWSPRYGIKGKIDLTVEVKIHDRNRGPIKKLMPLELKTGRPTHSVEHKGQVTLYSMMSSDRREDPQAGLLLYLKDGSMSNIPADHANQRGLVQLRNEMAHHLKQTVKATEGSGLPSPINSARSCQRCPHLLTCCMYQKTMETPPADPSHAMAALVPQTLGHLSERHLGYFQHWVRLMMVELAAEGASRGGIQDLWCRTGLQREQAGQCLCGMILDSCQNQGNLVTQTGQVRHVFTRSGVYSSTVKLSEVGIGANDNLVVSAENKPLIALTMGSVCAISDSSVTLILDRDLRLTDPEGDLVYRLDKADTYNSMATNMANLARLMENNETSARLREIVIEKKTPEFEMTMSKGVIEKVKNIFKRLNKPQKTAILKVLMCKDYVLIKGYPGTGKTSTIVSLVRVLTLLGRSVLITSYTHSAVDNILLKLIQHDVDFVRLGRLERIHPDVKPYSAELQTLTMQTVEELAQFYDSKPVVATTCLGVGSHALFSRRTFDVCVVDEASQVLQPACLAPLQAATRFVLVGDPLQLPPVVQSNAARDQGMEESLFARLDDTGGTYELNVQYRMNSEIMRLSNDLVYSGALQCGSTAVANAVLTLTHAEAPGDAADWVQQTLRPDARVIFLDTSKMTQQQLPRNGDKTDGLQNLPEALLVHQLVQVALQAGVKAEQVGVISPYRQQVALVRDLLRRHLSASVEVNTVDQYQGRDKNLIVVSFVRNQVGKGAGILEDLRRLNVALTRARHKLVLIGDASILTGYAPLKAVLAILRPEQILTLPENAAKLT